MSYNLYRSTTSGFTPSSSNQIASGLTAASPLQIRVFTASTTYYYVVEAVDEDLAPRQHRRRVAALPLGPLALRIRRLRQG